ncbi:tape measure protein [Porcipelethomonas sp.]|uniref:tape measure protein n=1 Tax=Porcipelethomonas sp. TaxID=2981675 RepID=UPI003EF9EA8B
MASIKTVIELSDRFSGPMMGIIQAANAGCSAMDSVQAAMSSNFDITPFDNIQAEIERTIEAADSLDAALRNIDSPSVSLSAVPGNTRHTAANVGSDETIRVHAIVSDVSVPENIRIPVEATVTRVNFPENQIISIPVSVQPPESADIPVQAEMPPIDTGGIQDYRNEIVQAEASLAQLRDMQSSIAERSRGISVMPESIRTQIDSVERSIENLGDSISALYQNPVDLGTDEIQQEIAKVNSSILEVTNSQSKLNSALQEMEKAEPPPGLDAGNVQRYQDEINKAAELLQQVSVIQDSINEQSQIFDVIPKDTKTQINTVNQSIEQMEQALNYIRENPFDLDSETARMQIIELNNSIKDTLNSQSQLKDAMQKLSIDSTSSVDIPVNPVAPDPLINATEPVQIPVQWQSDTLDVFTNTGIERFQQEVQSTNSMLNQLTAAQSKITQQAESLNILPPEAVSDIQGMQSRIQELQSSIEQIEQKSLDIGSDKANAQLERLRTQLSQTLNCQENLNLAMQGMDIGDINSAYLQLSHNVNNLERSVRDSFSKPVEIPITWESETLDVFTGTGIERFQQEIQSTNNMLNTLNSTQQKITAAAAQTDLFPAGSIADMNNMQSRLQAIQQRIQSIENNPVNMDTDSANAELEQLRGQLDKAIQEQQQLNSAIEQMDVSGANEAYLRLSGTIGNTERYIRDNITEQGQFNQTIEQGTHEASQLMDTIKRAAAAYVSIQSIGKIIDLSDELTQTTARIDLMNDGLQTTDQLTDMVYLAAQNARGSFTDMASVVAKFGNNAGAAFGSSEEVVEFAELVQKQMTIAGASTTEASNATLQLSQALASGVLRGDELNSIFEQAPNLIQSIADYMGVGIGEIRDMASEGQITADIVKNAVFSASDDINAKFEEMPITFEQIWQSFKNTAIMAFQPVLEQLSEFANSEEFQIFVNSVINALAIVAGVVAKVFGVVVSVASFIAENWSLISPIIYGVAAALAVYYGWQLLCSIGSAIMSMPAVMGFIALIAIIFSVCSAIAKFTGVANSGFGVICGGVNIVIQFFKNLGLSVANIALGIGDAISALCSNMKTAFHNAICNVQSWFYDLLSTGLTVIEGICEALNKLPFVEFDYSGITNSADEYAAKAAEAAGNKEEYESIGDAFREGYNTFDTFQDGWVSDAFDSGAAWGDKISDKISGLLDGFGTDSIPNPDDYSNYGGYSGGGVSDGGFEDIGSGISDIGGGVDDIAGNTEDIADSIDITEEELKYLRDIAEQETVNRFTTAEIKIEQTNHNNISSEMDLDGIVAGLTDVVKEATSIMAEGVHT